MANTDTEGNEVAMEDDKPFVQAQESEEPVQNNAFVQAHMQNQVKKFANKWKEKADATIAKNNEEKDMSGYVRFQKEVRKWLEWKKWDYLVGVIITLNAVTIGCGLETGNDAFNAFELPFLIIYTLELSLHFIGKGLDCLKDNWTRADIFFVVTGWISELIALIDLGDDAALLDQLILLRTLRLLKCARPLRLLSKFKELWIMVSGLMGSATTIAYTILMLAASLFIFACLGIEAVYLPNYTTTDDETLKQLLDDNFGGLGLAMLTLTQFIGMDSVGGIYTPIIIADPLQGMIFFSTVVLVVAIVLMNLVTAVIVDNALAQASSDKDQQRQQKISTTHKKLDQMKQLLDKMDTNGDGMVDIDELRKAGSSTMAELREMLNVEKVGPVTDIFKCLDLDPNVEHKRDDFFERIREFIDYDGTTQMRVVEKSIEHIEDRLTDMEGFVKNLCVCFGVEQKTGTGEASRAMKKALSVSQQHSCKEKKDTEKFDAGQDIIVGEGNWMDKSTKMAKMISHHQYFDLGVGFIILANTVILGVDLNLQCENNTNETQTAPAGILFLCVFTLELMLHFFADGRESLKSAWIKMDIFFIGMGWVSQIGKLLPGGDIVPPWVLLLRTVRLLKLAKPFRLVYSVKEMWTMVSGLMASVSTMAYTIGLLGAILYIFGCLAVELITISSVTSTRSKAWGEIQQMYFKDLPVTMLTLTQFIGMDSVSSIYTVLIKESPAMMSIYFGVLVLIVAVVLMNLITAVIVDTALQNAASDTEQQQTFKRQLDKENDEELRKQIDLIDTKGQAGIRKEDLMRVPKQVQEALMDELLRIRPPFELRAKLDDIKKELEKVEKLQKHTEEKLQKQTEELQKITLPKELQEPLQAKLQELEKEHSEIPEGYAFRLVEGKVTLSANLIGAEGTTMARKLHKQAEELRKKLHVMPEQKEHHKSLHAISQVLDHIKHSTATADQCIERTGKLRKQEFDLQNKLKNVPLKVFDMLQLDPAKSYSKDDFYKKVIDFKSYDGTLAQQRLEREVEHCMFRMKVVKTVMEQMHKELTKRDWTPLIKLKAIGRRTGRKSKKTIKNGKVPVSPNGAHQFGETFPASPNGTDRVGEAVLEPLPEVPEAAE